MAAMQIKGFLGVRQAVGEQVEVPAEIQEACANLVHTCTSENCSSDSLFANQEQIEYYAFCYAKQ